MALQSESASMLPTFQGKIPKALKHVLEIIYLIIHKDFNRQHATKFVANQYNVFPSTIQDQYCRKLNLSASDFDHLIDEPDLINLRKRIKQVYPQHDSTINEFL